MVHQYLIKVISSTMDSEKLKSMWSVMMRGIPFFSLSSIPSSLFRWHVRNYDDKKVRVKNVVCYRFALPAIVDISVFETARTTPFDLESVSPPSLSPSNPFSIFSSSIHLVFLMPLIGQQQSSQRIILSSMTSKFRRLSPISIRPLSRHRHSPTIVIRIQIWSDKHYGL